MLNCHRQTGVTSLEGIQALRNLTSLDLHYNKISDVKPLRGLTKLTTLTLNSNQISDVEPLIGLTELTDLSLSSHHQPCCLSPKHQP
ncbi:MAG TPA: leucine-rich repeat domain-containing protein [Oculatellaceae cyanobacterium]